MIIRVGLRRLGAIIARLIPGAARIADDGVTRITDDNVLRIVD